jgi:glycosyltransferase involved in cell wall biosynthesis
MKTNQINGAEVALRCAHRWGKPLIGRMGYLWSDFVARENGAVTRARTIEDELFRSADRIVVTTAEMASTIGERIPPGNAKTVVIPNYVETDRFAPDSGQIKDFDVIFVGRLSPQKNLSALLMALRGIDAKAMIIGDGSLRNELKSQFDDLRLKISWRGNVPNSELPALMNQSSIFVLPSHYEGHPKTLIEAMACGMPVIGADSPGIRNIINHGLNGYLCDPEPENLRSAIKNLLGNFSQRDFLGKNARQYVVDNFSLEIILKKEYEIYREVLSENKEKLFN